MILERLDLGAFDLVVEEVGGEDWFCEVGQSMVGCLNGEPTSAAAGNSLRPPYSCWRSTSVVVCERLRPLLLPALSSLRSIEGKTFA